MRVVHKLGLALGCTLASSALGSPLYTFTGSTVEVASPGLHTTTFDSAGGAGSVSFSIVGFNTLDGGVFGALPFPPADVFTLSLNGTAVLSGSYALGGGGSDITYFAPDGATVSTSSPGYNLGGTAILFVPLDLEQGSNKLTFAYSSEHPQGIADEGFSISGVSVSGPAAVVEPASWAMLIVGFGLIGVTARHRTSQKRRVDLLVSRSNLAFRDLR